MRCHIIILLIFFASLFEPGLFSQSESTSPILYVEEYIAQVQDQYPLLELADIQTEIGDANLLKSKGAFDVTLETNFNQKFFSETNYYRIFNGGAEWQSPYAFKLQSGVDLADGIFLNPERNFPESGLGYLGISLPIGRGLLIDKARAGLQDARLFRELQLQKRLQLRNEVMAQALDAYFEWVQSNELYQTYKEITKAARDRYRFVILAYEGGDLSPIDTLEASMQWRQRKLELTAAQNKRRTAEARIQNFTPSFDLQNWSSPSFNEIAALWQTRSDEFWENSLLEHPKILDLQIQRERILVDQKLAREYLKPKVDIKYQWLSSLNQIQTGDINSTLSPNDYTWGISFSYPIPMRAARGKLQINKIKQFENQFKITQLRQELNARMKALLEIQSNFEDILKEYNILIEDFRRLLQAERNLFELGESSLFLVNTRENRLLSAQITYINLQYSAFKNLLNLAKTSGNLEGNLGLLNE
ncbi:MAG: TolC family protein [Bacteroidetes bacterium]|nr:TolC family protein [Bacteroidota bacterium]